MIYLEKLAPYVPLFQTIIWIILILATVIIFLQQFKKLLETIRIRIERGSSFKAGPIELGEDLQQLQAEVGQADADFLTSFDLVLEGAEEEEEEEKEALGGDEPAIQLNKNRLDVYEDNSNIFLTHVIRPSAKQDQKFDIFIYLIRHKDQGFDDVKFADFFLGPYWGNKVFRRYEQNGKIGFSTAAYGTFLCLCEVQMKDGNKISLSRYIDFEMGRAFDNKA